MVDGLVLNSNDAPPPLIHRHSSFGTNTDNDNYPQKLDFSNQKNNDVFEDDNGIDCISSEPRLTWNSKKERSQRLLKEKRLSNLPSFFVLFL